MASESEYVDLGDRVISVDYLGGFWTVLWNGAGCKRFYGEDAECRAHGYAMALSDERPLRRGW